MGFAQEYKVLYVDTIQSTYIINDTLKGERYVIRHTYGFDTVQMKQDIHTLNVEYSMILSEKQEMIQEYNKRLLAVMRERNRLINLLNKIRE